MKIAIDCRLIGQSGIGTFIENVIHYMVESTDHEFVLIGNMERLKPYSQRVNCRIVECSYESFTLKELFSFPVSEVNRCDAFFTPNFNIPMGIRVPIFSTIHDVVFFDVDGICSPLGKFIRWLYMKRALAMSRVVFTVSNFSRQRIGAILGYKDKIKVIYNGVSNELILYKKEHKTPEGKNGDYIVCLGNLKKYKGVKSLIAAFQLLKAKGDFNCRLIIIGRIDARTQDDELIRMVNSNHADIQFVTDADNKQVYKLLAGAKALVSPSHYEGFGIPPLEAMYLGTPAIISDIPTYREIYHDTPVIFFKTGDVQDLAKKLQQISSDRCDVEKVVNERYNFKSTAQQVLQCVQEE